MSDGPRSASGTGRAVGGAPRIAIDALPGAGAKGQGAGAFLPDRPGRPFGRIVLASGNAGKLREFRRLLAPLGIGLLTQAEMGIGEADEPHATFVENALAKARHASAAAGLPALADDSGLCVRALGGAPGVRSARYAGDPRSDARNNAKLIADLSGVEDRRAHYCCALVLLHDANDPQPIVAEGEWHGTIIDAARGSGGFGYDAHFLDPETGMTGAELPLERKNALSHRGKAMRALIERLRADRGMKARPVAGA